MVSSSSLSLNGVSRAFGSTTAVDDVTLSFAPGTVVGLVGENGAGKTTLMRLAAGEIAPDAGTIQRPRRVGMVHQHFSLVPEFTIAENLALLDLRTFGFVTARRLRESAAAVVQRSGIELGDLSRRVSTLSVGEAAKVELIKAVAVDPDLLILDEPTAVLTPPEAAELFAVMRRLAEGGTTVVFITHKVREVLETAARVVVMRRGRVVADAPASSMTAAAIAEAMVGAITDGARQRAARSTGNEILLRMDGVSTEMLRDVSLSVRRGQIVAVVGVAGNGQTELAETLRGLRAPVRGTLEFAPDRAAFVPEDRTRDGLVAQMTVAENLALGSGRWSPASARTRAERLITSYRIRATGPGQRAGALSGGNQQKVVLARELDRKPDLIIAAEPTRGLDVASAQFVHEQLTAAAARGAGLLLISSDLDEAFALADVVHVINRGRISAPLAPEAAAANIGPLLAGLQ